MRFKINKKRLLLALSSSLIASAIIVPSLIIKNDVNTIDIVQSKQNSTIDNSQISKKELIKKSFIDDVANNKFVVNTTKEIIKPTNSSLFPFQSSVGAAKINSNFSLELNNSNFLPIESEQDFIGKTINKINIPYEVKSGVFDTKYVLGNQLSDYFQYSKSIENNFGFFKTYSPETNNLKITNNVSFPYVYTGYNVITPSYANGHVGGSYPYYQNRNLNFIKDGQINFKNESIGISNIDLSKFFKIYLDSSNNYSNNGLVWTKAPELKIELNFDYINVLQELNNLNNSYNALINSKSKNDINGYPIYAGVKNEWFNIIAQNIFNRSKTSSEINNDIINCENNIAPTLKNSILDIYNVASDFGINFPNISIDKSRSFYQIKNIDDYVYPYQIFLNFFKNYKINISYETPNSLNASSIRNVAIWDGNQFNTIKLESIPIANETYIKLKKISFKKIGNMEMYLNPIKITDINFDSSYSNISKTSNEIIYKSLFREYAKNYQLLNQNEWIVNRQAITINTDKYVTDLLREDNTFIDPTFLFNKINNSKPFVDYPNFFSNINSITSALPNGVVTNYLESLKKWNLWDDYYRKINFVRNNYNGLFYAFCEVINYKINIIDPNLIKAIENNDDIIKLEPIDKNTNNAYFLVRFKTNKLNNMLYENTNIDLQDTSNITSLNSDRANPLFSLNIIDDINKTYKFNEQNIKNLLNNQNNLIDEIIKKNNFFTDTIINKKKINWGNQLILNFKNYEINYAIDKNLSEYLATNDLYKYANNPDQYCLAYLHHSLINFTDKNGNGRIVNKLLDGTFEINQNYKFKNTLITNGVNTTIGTFTITNKNDSNKFNLNLTNGEMMDILNQRYANSNTFKNSYNDLLISVDNQLLQNEKTTVKYNGGAIGGITTTIIFSLILIIATTLIIIKRKKEKDPNYLLK